MAYDEWPDMVLKYNFTQNDSVYILSGTVWKNICKAIVRFELEFCKSLHAAFAILNVIKRKKCYLARSFKRKRYADVIRDGIFLFELYSFRNTVSA